MNVSKIHLVSAIKRIFDSEKQVTLVWWNSFEKVTSYYSKTIWALWRRGRIFTYNEFVIIKQETGKKSIIILCEIWHTTFETCQEKENMQTRRNMLKTNLIIPHLLSFSYFKYPRLISKIKKSKSRTYDVDFYTITLWAKRENSNIEAVAMPKIWFHDRLGTVLPRFEFAYTQQAKDVRTTFRCINNVQMTSF